MTTKIHPIPLVGLLGRGEKAKFTHLFNHGQDVRFGYYVWLIQDAGQNILVDAGGTAEQATEHWGRPRDTVTHIQTLEEGLARHGLAVADINIVILTHLHLDHVAYIRDLIHARFIVQKAELEFARAPHPADRFYDARVVEGLELETVEGDYQVTPSVRTVFTPGHTPGGQSVAVETERGVAIITGFCCIEENFFPGERIQKSMPLVVPGVHLDVIKAYDSMVKVRDLAAILVPNHDAKWLDGAAIG
ncbi:N-acyl homoserine lactonase family protein [Ramlibacter sp. AW1]|uniref:N-acyl homoserine lactonase family protein n=1 Tax=Ramlibacter aurantiacus TaxID=2801330 RepID=A0A936ZMS5_9BURK|nr:N-acyl homoserine lactonase family protein [Ramlibacter aurantiacus]MBL0422627.1 N-acyl homoserine lactonase family protein [Ramlibacter aurantiacus]